MFWGGLFADRAFSGLVESRLNNLESDFNRLESQVNRIENQLNRTGVAKIKVPNLPTSQRSSRRLSQRERDKMFDRLATLVIELKQDIKNLQQRVSELENVDN